MASLSGRNIIRFDIDISRAANKMYRFEKDLDTTAEVTVDDIADYTKNYARTIAPYYSGHLVRNIKKKKLSEYESEVQALNPRANRLWPGRGKYGSSFNLVRWMHETGGRFQSNNPLGKAGTKHITSGDPKFMFTTRNEIRRVAPGIAKGKFNKIVLKYQ